MKAYGLFFTLLAFSITASAKSAYVGVLTGLGVGSLEMSSSSADSDITASFELGPTLYVDLNKRLTFRTSLFIKSFSNQYDDDQVLFDDAEINFSQYIVALGLQLNLNSKVALFGDFNYSLSTFNEDCSSSLSDFDCSSTNELKDNVSYIKLGASIRFVKWFRLEPYVFTSLSSVGDNYFKNMTLVGANAVFAW